jgi:hypothetical protein
MASTSHTPTAETAPEAWVLAAIGPRKVGGRYRCGYDGGEYTVLAIDAGPRVNWPTAWQITVLHDGWDYPVDHCTAWNPKRDTILTEPAADQAPMIHWAYWGSGQPNKCGIPAESSSEALSEVTCPGCRASGDKRETSASAAASPAPVVDAPPLRPRRRAIPRRRRVV